MLDTGFEAALGNLESRRGSQLPLVPNLTDSGPRAAVQTLTERKHLTAETVQLQMDSRGSAC